MVILENIDIDIDIDKAILQNIDIDKISNRFKFGISNRATLDTLFSVNLWDFNFQHQVSETMARKLRLLTVNHLKQIVDQKITSCSPQGDNLGWDEQAHPL